MNIRQRKILVFIQSHPEVSSNDIYKYLIDIGFKVSDMTIVRDLDTLIKNGYVKKSGKTKSALYSFAEENKGHLEYSVEDYFNLSQDERGDIKHFDQNVFKLFERPFLDEELYKLQNITNEYREHIANISPIQLKKDTERLTIDLSWKSSKIEGNTYDLIETEALIKQHKQAPGHSKEEAKMLLNHKRAIDYIFAHKDFKKLSLAKIEDLHRMLVEGLDVPFGLRKHAVAITGTNYQPIDNIFQIQEAVQTMIDAINKEKEPIAKALMTVLLVSYIQPFADGNKRTARILANAVLISHDQSPISYRSVDESVYKKAMVIFYEQQSFAAFKKIFMEQYIFAVNNYYQQ